MGLEAIMKFGYIMLLGTVALMIYVSLTYADQHQDQPGEKTNHPPCFFNPLCTCSKVVPDLGHVTCRDVPMARMPRHINNSRVYFLQLENNGLGYIEPYFLESTNLYRIEISRNNLTDITPDAFVGLERTLWELDLHSNHLTNVPSRAIRHLQKLRLLNLTDNEITDVAADNFRGVEETLEHLILRANGISNLQPDVFSALQQLQVLDLSGNALLELASNVFRDGPPRLTHLILADNALHSFPYEQVANFRNLHELDLSRNRISQMQQQTFEEGARNARISLTLDTLRLEYNQLQFLPTRAFENFKSINSTYLDGNPISVVQSEAFRGPHMKELYLRDCGIAELAPNAFAGLEPSLIVLDLSGNNLTQLPNRLFHEFDFLRTVSLRENLILGINPSEAFGGFQYSMIQLDLSGYQNSMISVQDLKRMRNLRSLTLSRLPQPNLSPEDFQDVGVDLRDLKISNGQLKGIRSHAFKNVQSLEKLDLSENSINSIENDAFAEVGDTISYLNLAAGFSSSVTKVPAEAFRHLTYLRHLDLSNNDFRTLPETSFHSMRNLEVLHLEDNEIDSLPKGTFQGEIHNQIQKIFLSFNQLSTISTHSFVSLRRVDTIRLDDNRLNRIDKRAFMDLDKLQYLSLRGNRLNYIAEEAFQKLPALQELDLAYNEMRNFEFSTLDQVGSLSSFRLNMSHNLLRRLENNATLYVTDRMRGGVMHTNIEELDFSHNNITSIGRWYFRAVETSLTHLHLSHNSLRNLTRELIGNMRHLQWLDVSYNRLTEIDFDTLKSTQNLQVFLADHNDLYELPKEIFRGLGNLRVVDISYNHLQHLRDVLFERGVEVLRVSGNLLTRVPVASFTADTAASLVHFDCSDNDITALHPADVFAKFQSLQFLDLSRNRLVRLDDGAFSQLPLLIRLDLSGNNDLSLDSRGFTFQGVEDTLQELYLRNLSMHVVPEMHLPTLRVLDLSENDITQVPFDLPQNLSSLRTLLLSGNHLTAVPTPLPHFTQLRTLSIARNPISTLTFPQGLRIRELDIRHLPLEMFEICSIGRFGDSAKLLKLSFKVGTLGRIPTLRVLRLSPDTRDMNLPHLLQDNPALETLQVEVWDRSASDSLTQVFNGPLPFKLRDLIISGRGVKTLPNNFLQGIQSSILHLTVHNTSLETIPRSVFERATHVRTLRIDVRGNWIRKLGNPNTAGQPGIARKMFLMDLKMEGNRWNCDCELGWVEGWERKKRQYFCSEAWDKCKTMDDDLRLARCDNKQHQRVIDVLKNDLECGWNSAPHLGFFSILTLTLLAAVIIRV